MYPEMLFIALVFLVLLYLAFLVAIFNIFHPLPFGDWHQSLSSNPLLLKLEEQWDGKFLRYDPVSFNKPIRGVHVRLGAGLFSL